MGSRVLEVKLHPRYGYPIYREKHRGEWTLWMKVDYCVFTDLVGGNVSATFIYPPSERTLRNGKWANQRKGVFPFRATFALVRSAQ